MVRACLAVALVTAVTPALADDGDDAPVASPVEVDPAGCGVQLRRAPEDARAVIAAQLAADPSACAGTLEVWIISSEGGLYVQARDGLGRVRERVVADAATAATLLASWVEIDAAQPLWTPAPTPAPPAPAPVTVAVAAPAHPATLAPGETAAVSAVAAPPRRARSTRSVGFAVIGHRTGTGMSGAGARLDVDLRRWRGWQLGGAASARWLDGGLTVRDPLAPQLLTREIERQTFDVLLTARRQLVIGPVTLAATGGVGVGVGRHQLYSWMENTGNTFEDAPYSVGPSVEAAASAGVRLVGRWQLEAGVATSMAGYLYSSGARPPVWADGGTSLLAGVRYRP